MMNRGNVGVNKKKISVGKEDREKEKNKKKRK